MPGSRDGAEGHVHLGRYRRSKSENDLKLCKCRSAHCQGYNYTRHMCIKNAYKHFNCVNVCHQLVPLRTFLFINKIYFHVMCMGVLPASTSAPHACHAHRVQKRALAPLELKSQIAVGTIWVLEIIPRLCERTAIALNY